MGSSNASETRCRQGRSLWTRTRGRRPVSTVLSIWCVAVGRAFRGRRLRRPTSSARTPRERGGADPGAGRRGTGAGIGRRGGGRRNRQDEDVGPPLPAPPGGRSVPSAGRGG